MGVKFTLDWYGSQIQKQVTTTVIAGGEAVGQRVSQEAKRLVSRPNPTGASPSAPGEPPKRVTGALLDSIDYQVEPGRDQVAVYVGAAVQHALYLEFGTSKMAARPFMRPAVSNVSRQIVGLFAKG